MKDLELVSFDLAKTLKEIGFKVKVNSWVYIEEGNYDRVNSCYHTKIDYNSQCDDRYSLPTLEFAKMWFRVNHNIHIIVDRDFDDWVVKICEFSQGNKYTNYIREHSSHDKALEAGLLKACEIIKGDSKI